MNINKLVTDDDLINFLLDQYEETGRHMFLVAANSVQLYRRDISLLNFCLSEQNKWISVEERLPSSEDLERSQFHNFLVANEFGEVREAVFTGKYFAKLGSRLSGVTHWMPLPEPPKQ